MSIFCQKNVRATLYRAEKNNIFRTKICDLLPNEVIIFESKTKYWKHESSSSCLSKR